MRKRKPLPWRGVILLAAYVALFAVIFCGAFYAKHHGPIKLAEEDSPFRAYITNDVYETSDDAVNAKIAAEKESHKSAVCPKPKPIECPRPWKGTPSECVINLDGVRP